MSKTGRGQASAIIWFRQDLRLTDQAALAAAARGGAVIPVYVLDDETPGDWRIGGAQRWWPHHSLAALAAALESKGSRLILRKGKAHEVLAGLAQEAGTCRIHALRHYEPWWKKAEAAVAKDHELRLHDGNYLAPPAHVVNGSNARYRIFTPWWRALKAQMPPQKPIPAPGRISAPPKWPVSDRLSDWNLLSTRPNWANQFGQYWQPGEDGGRAALDRFLPALEDYENARNLPSHDAARAFRRTCISARSRPRRSGIVARRGHMPRPSPICARSGGGISAPMSSTSFRITHGTTAARAMRCAGAPADQPTRIMKPGPKAAPATPSLTPECANFGRSAGCTTACG